MAPQSPDGATSHKSGSPPQQKEESKGGTLVAVGVGETAEVVVDIPRGAQRERQVESHGILLEKRIGWKG